MRIKLPKIFPFLLLLFICIHCIANGNSAEIVKGSLTGMIVDALTKKPIAGASIVISDLKQGTYSASNGLYSLTNLPDGNHLLEVSHIGYTTLIVNINIIGNTTYNVSLTESIVENNEVIITGVSNATQLKKVPFQVNVLKKNSLLQNAYSNIIEALTKIPGVTSVTTGPAISKPVIRGLGFNRLVVINDGVRQEGQQWGDEHGIEIDEYSAGKIEIMKGPASIMYGSDAMAGVINIISHLPTSRNTIHGKVISNYQSNNRARTLHANVSGNNNGLHWNASLTQGAAADYQNKYDGRVLNSKFNQFNTGGFVGYNGAWGYSHLLFSSFSMNTGLVEGERDDNGLFVSLGAGGIMHVGNSADFNSTTPLFPYQRIRHKKIASDNSIILKHGKLNFNVGYQKNEREEFGNPDQPNERALQFDLQTTTYTLTYFLPKKNGISTSLGINGMKQYNTNKGIEQIIPNYEMLDAGGFIYAQKNFPKLSLSGGIRYDARNLNAANLISETTIKSEAFKKQFSNVSGSIGIAHQLSKQLNVKLNIARAYRAPSIPELASNGAHEGTFRYEYGNLQLKNETSVQLDGGLEYNSSHLSINVTAFYNNFNNFIFYSKLSNSIGGDSTINLDGENLTAYQYNQQEAVIQGIEATLDIHPHPLDWLHIENSFSILHGQFKNRISNSKYLPFMPAPRVLSEVRANIDRVKKYIKNLYCKIELDNTFDQSKIFSTFNTETRTDGYSLFNAGIGAEIVTHQNKQLFNIYFSGNNLTNVAYQNHLSRLKYSAVHPITGRQGVFNMGRNFSVKILIPFNKNLKTK